MPQPSAPLSTVNKGPTHLGEPVTVWGAPLGASAPASSVQPLHGAPLKVASWAGTSTAVYGNNFLLQNSGAL